MQPNIIINQKDPKLCLLKKIFNDIDNRTTMQIFARNGIHNINLFMDCFKIILISMFFTTTLSDVIRQLQTDKKFQKFFEFNNIVEIQEFYEFFGRFDEKQINDIVNSILKPIYSNKRRSFVTYIVDASPVGVDINHLKKYISKEKLEKLDLKWGYSKTKTHYIGFKVTMVIDKETLCPVSMLIHPGSPHDSVIYEEVLQELKRRGLFKKNTKMLFDRGYYSMKNYKMGIYEYNIVPIIFPKYKNTYQKLSDKLSYTLDVYFSKKGKQIKEELERIKRVLLKNIKNWKELKSVRSIIEDVFKVSKQAFGLDTQHRYTTKSVSKHTYLCLLLTALAIKQGYNTKTKLQQLAEGNVELREPIEHRKKNKKAKKEKTTKENVPLKTQQQTLDVVFNKRPKTLLDYI